MWLNVGRLISIYDEISGICPITFFYLWLGNVIQLNTSKCLIPKEIVSKCHSHPRFHAKARKELHELISQKIGKMWPTRVLIYRNHWSDWEGLLRNPEENGHSPLNTKIQYVSLRWKSPMQNVWNLRHNLRRYFIKNPFNQLIFPTVWFKSCQIKLYLKPKQ